MSKHFRCSQFSLLSAIMILFVASQNLKAQTESMIYPEQFMFKDFTNGKVLMKGGSGYDMLMNYNLAFEKVVIILEKKICDLSNPGSVDTIYLLNRKFIPVGPVFYEVLAKKPFLLFVQHRVIVTLPPKMDSYGKIPETGATDAKKILIIGNKSNSSGQDLIFTREEVYWVQVDNKLQSFRDALEFVKIFPNLKNELKQYIRQNKIKFENPDSIEKLANYCNSLLTSRLPKS